MHGCHVSAESRTHTNLPAGRQRKARSGLVTGQVAEKVGSLSAPKQGGHQVSFTYAPEGSMPVSIVTEAQHLRQADSLAPL